MTLSLGNVDAGLTLYIPWHTFDSNGSSITLTGLAVGDIIIYKNGSVTQRSSTAGFALLDTDGIDFDGITGIHGISIDLADNTDAGFYSAGAFYWVVISAVTVDTRTLNFVLATFRIGPVAANVTQLVGDAQSATDLKDFADAGYDPATNKVEGVKLADTLTTYTGNTLQTGDSFARLGAPAGASVSADIAAIEAQTDDIGASGAGLTALGDARLANLDATVSSRLDTAGYTAPPAAATIAAAVLDEDMTAHQTQGSLGQAIGDPVADTNTIYKAVVTDAAGATVGVDVVAVKAETASLQTDTDDIQAKIGTPAGASVSADIAAIEAQTDDIGVAGAGLTALGDARIANLDAAISTRATPTNITAGTITTVTNLTNAPTVGDLTATMKASVNAEVLDVLTVDTFAQPGQEAPAATNTLKNMLAYAFKFLRNRVTQTSTTLSIFADNGTTVDQKATISDDTVTYDRGEIGSGP